MPRPNAGRSVGAESNLILRITRELKVRHWSPAEFAKRVTDAGCPIQTSAIYKILNGDPPRKITVDELFAMASAFGTTISDLTTPLEVVDDRRAKELLEEIERAQELLYRAVAELVRTGYELFSLRGTDVGDYVFGHLNRTHFRPDFIGKMGEVDEQLAMQAELVRGMAAAEGGRLAILEREMANPSHWTYRGSGDGK